MAADQATSTTPLLENWSNTWSSHLSQMSDLSDLLSVRSSKIAKTVRQRLVPLIVERLFDNGVKDEMKVIRYQDELRLFGERPVSHHFVLS